MRDFFTFVYVNKKSSHANGVRYLFSDSSHPFDITLNFLVRLMTEYFHVIFSLRT